MSEMDLSEKQALAAAVEMEKKGYDFFRKSSSEAKYDLAREVFEFLAAEELNHIRAIERFNREYLSGKSTDADKAIEDLKAGRPKAAIEELFRGLSKSAPVEGVDLDVYRFAMDFERKGQEFYRKAETSAQDPNAKRLYAFLIGEEGKHFKIVESCLLYFDNTQEFFHRREGWHVEG